MTRISPLAVPAVFAGAILLSSYGGDASPLDAARHIPIQHNGRIKPFESFSRQTVQLITGTERWHKKDPTALVLERLADRTGTASLEWIRVDYPELKQALDLPETRHFFSIEEIAPSLDRIRALVRSAKENRDADIRPSKLGQKAETLFSQVMTAQSLVSGEMITVIPPPDFSEWRSPYESDIEASAEWKNLIRLYREGPAGEFGKRAGEWNDRIFARRNLRAKISLEVLYFRMKPFDLAAAAYFAAFLLSAFFHGIKPLTHLGLFLFCAAVAFHAAGLVMRILVLERPPVSNMYESMVFMSWALIVFAAVFSVLRRNTVPVTAGALAGSLVMIYARLLPIDPGLDVLVPVLRSNYWLTIHVLTIVSSYGAFGLATALGHRHLLLSAFYKFTKQAEEESAGLVHRVVQLGTILVGAGTVFGGVWANESWGRFWGWDPKETWTLITFLGYLIAVHLRHAGKLSNFGLALFSILGFLLVLMTWYGVNFVLGRGLHSYGQGAGGMAWVARFLVLEALFVGFILLKKSAETHPARPVSSHQNRG